MLRNAPLGEADLLVSLLTPYHGKVRATARGARKPTSRMVGHMEPLTRLDAVLAEGRSLDTISQAQVLDAFRDLKMDLDATSRGLYVAELLDGFAMEGSGNPGLFTLACQVLHLLAAPDTGPDLLLRYFELHLLKLSGFMPELYACVECRTIPAPGSHHYSPDGGGLICAGCKPSDLRVMPLSVEALELLRFLDGSRPEHAARLSVTSELSGDLKALLAATVRYWLDRDVRSARFVGMVDIHAPDASQ